MIWVDYFANKNSSIWYYIAVYDGFARALSNLKYCEHQEERMILFKKVGRVASSFNCAPSSDFTLPSSETYYMTDRVVVIWRFTNGATLYRFVVRLLKMVVRSVSFVPTKNLQFAIWIPLCSCDSHVAEISAVIRQYIFGICAVGLYRLPLFLKRSQERVRSFCRVCYLFSQQIRV